MHSDEHAHVRFSIRHEYPETLQKDGKLDEKKSGIIDRGRDVDPLRLL